MDEAIRVVKEFVAGEASNAIDAYAGEDQTSWFQRGFRLFLFKQDAPAGHRYTPMTIPVAMVQVSHLSPAERTALSSAVEPRTFFWAATKNSPLGPVVSTMIGGTTPFKATLPRTRFDVACIGASWKIASIWALCPQCFGTGTHDGQTCTWQTGPGRACENGWIFEGGLRLELGEATETQHFAPRPEDERYHAVYDG